MSPAAALTIAAAGSASYGCATVLQAGAARRIEAATTLSPTLFLRLLRSWPYLTGLGLDLVGFAATVISLRTLPLFTVQAIVAASVGVTAILATKTLGMALSRRSVLALVALVTGLVALGAAARPGPARPLDFRGSLVLLGAAAAVAIVGAAAARSRSSVAGLLLAALTGAAFGAVSIAARGLTVPHPLWHLAASPAAVAIALYSLLAAVMLPTALQRAAVTTAAAVMLIVETVVPASVGVAVLGDATRGRLGATMAATAFAVTVAATVSLARYLEPGKPVANGSRSGHRG